MRFFSCFIYTTNGFFLKRGRGPTSKKLLGFFCQLITPEKNPDLHTSFTVKLKKTKNTLEKKTTVFDPGKGKTTLFDIQKDDELGMQENYLENFEIRKPSVINYVHFKIAEKVTFEKSKRSVGTDI